MAPPFLAYYAVTTSNVSLLLEMVRQCGLYGEVLQWDPIRVRILRMLIQFFLSTVYGDTLSVHKFLIQGFGLQGMHGLLLG
jgi:hypothetical protein